MVNLFNRDGRIAFDPDKHIYTDTQDPNHPQYTNVSKVIASASVPFDREGISLRMAKGNKAKQEEILREWDRKRDSSIARGNRIHDHLELFILTGRRHMSFERCYPVIEDIMKSSYMCFPEALTYSTYYQIAGQSDLVVQRQKSRASVFDFYDYKTNESKGIEFDSINRSKDPIAHYNKFMLPPLAHLEDCNYNKYAMQLSIYAYLSETTWGIRVGRLAIIFIDLEMNVTMLAVPYMRYEAESLLDHYKNLKALPEVPKDKFEW